MGYTNGLPDPCRVLDALKRHAAAYDYGCWNRHDGELFDKCPYFASGHCVADSSADAVVLVEYLLNHQSEDSAFAGLNINYTQLCVSKEV